MLQLFTILFLIIISFNLSFAQTNESNCEPDIYGNVYCEPLVEDSLTIERLLTFDTNNLKDVSYLSLTEILIIIIFVFLIIIIPLLLIIYYIRKSKRN